MSFSCKKGQFDRYFNRLDRPVEESRPDRQPDRPVDPTGNPTGRSTRPVPVDPTGFHLWYSGVAWGEGGGSPPQVTPFWGDTLTWFKTITLLICGEDLAFLFRSTSFGPKTNCFKAKTFITYFWNEKRWHHIFPPRVPSSLATPPGKGGRGRGYLLTTGHHCNSKNFF